MQHYIFRSTTEKLPEHLEHIVESGDAVVGDPVFVGGRDWVLLCRKGAAGDDGLAQAMGRLRSSLDRLAHKLDGLEGRITAAVRRGAHDGASAAQRAAAGR